MRRPPTFRYRVHARFTDNGLDFGISVEAIPPKFFDTWDGSRDPKEVLIISPEMANVIMCRGFFSVPVAHLYGATLHDDVAGVRNFAYCALSAQERHYPSLIAFVATYHNDEAYRHDYPSGEVNIHSVIFGLETDAVQYALDTGESGDILNRKNGRW